MHLGEMIPAEEGHLLLKGLGKVKSGEETMSRTKVESRLMQFAGKEVRRTSTLLNDLAGLPFVRISR